MAKKARTRPRAEPRAVSAERAARLYRLLQLLRTRPQTRAALTRSLRLDIRGFYRDLELLRDADIHVELREGRYVLDQPAAEAVARLPFPDPHLMLGEVMQLAKGRSAAHRKLRALLAQIVR